MAKWTIEIELKKISKATYNSPLFKVMSDEEKDDMLLRASNMIENQNKSFIFNNQVFIKSNVARVIAEELEDEDE